MPHYCRLQPQAEADATGAAPKEALQDLGTHLEEGSGQSTRIWLDLV